MNADSTYAPLPPIFAQLGLAYDDVLLLPNETDVIPSEVDTTTHLTRNITMKVPAISAAMDGMLKRHLSGEALDKLLRSELIREEDSTEKHGLIDNIRNFFKVNANVDEKQDEENL